MAVSLVYCHHEGAGSPSDVPRGRDGGYSAWIGATQWERLRPPSTSFATLHYNHVSLDICLSGNRMVQPVTDNDIALIHAAFMDFHARGEVIATPEVHAHRDNNGKYSYHGSVFSTVCPGDFTMGRWSDVVAACRVVSTPPPISPQALLVLRALAKWKDDVTATPLREGDHGSNVAVLIDLLVHVGMLEKGTTGNGYGKKVVDAVHHFKRTRHFVDQGGEKFGGAAAAKILA